MVGGGRVARAAEDADWRHRQPGQCPSIPVGPDEVFRFALGPDLETRYVGLNSRGDTGDTLAWLRGPSSGPPAYSECKYEDRIAFFRVPFAPRFLQHPGPGGVRYSALTSDYRIFVTRNDGAEVLMVIERPLPAESFGNDEWRAANEEYHQWRATRPGASCDPRNRRGRPRTVHRGSLCRSGRQALGRGRAHGRQPLGGV